MLLRTMVAGLFSADGLAGCSGFAAHFFPDGFRPRRGDARTGKSGVKRGGKKAYVYLKKGDTISIA